MRLTESSEFQNGMEIAKCILCAFVLLGALLSLLVGLPTLDALENLADGRP